MKLTEIKEEEKRPYLHWNVIARMNTRSVSYAKKNMIAALERAGAVVGPVDSGVYDSAPPKIKSQVLDVKRYLKPDEDPKEVREKVTRAITTVCKKAPKRFLGLIDD